MAYIVMAYIVMAYMVMACIVMACIAMAYIVMDYVVMANVVMAYIVIAYIVMAQDPDRRHHRRPGHRPAAVVTAQWPCSGRAVSMQPHLYIRCCTVTVPALRVARIAGGVETHAITLFNNLDASSFDKTLIVTRAANVANTRRLNHDVTLHVLPFTCRAHASMHPCSHARALAGSLAWMDGANRTHAC